MGSLNGKFALVTGAGRGIGAATARKLSDAGARVMVNDLDADVAQQVADALPGAIAYPADLTEAGAADQMVAAAIEQFGGLDIIVNNAGYIWHSAIHNILDEQWDAMMDIHISAQFRVLRAYGRWLRTHADQSSPVRKIVNISSTMGLHGGATQLAYSAAKAAVVGLTRTLAKEWGRFNVTVNAVAFGAIETRLTSPYEREPNISMVKGKARKVGLSHEQIEHARRASPLNRMGTAEDAANAIYLMCIPESDWITGEVILASGGVRS
ncbi:MAG: 3-oxoacyl-[acyl-carrier protein] reductase [Cyclobacteriaceae bacterium]|jgi:3-oxoacyl-[acyl-carrier protein] reductase